MTIKNLVTEIVMREGRKSNVAIGDVREIVGLLSDIIYASDDAVGVVLMLLRNGKQRAKKKK
jgi:hypothetical protein